MGPAAARLSNAYRAVFAAHMQVVPLQVPDAHVLPAQHGCPVLPHDVQYPTESQTCVAVPSGEHAPRR